jgi:hypothetical protein
MWPTPPTKTVVFKVQRLAAIVALNYTGINAQRASSKDDA